MTTTLPTPGDLVIRPRDRRFARDTPARRLWHGGRPEATALYNALSATFPRGEAFFVESVRAFSGGASRKLAEEIRAFTTQEVVHSREHLAFNRRAADSGYDLAKLAQRVEERLAVTTSKPPIVSLAATMALEHFTAIVAHELLGNPSHLHGAEVDAAELWRWHACEEIEHKGVAYDTWLHATSHWTRFKRWSVKARVMLFITRNFVVDRTAGALELMRQDGIRGVHAWTALLWYMWVRPGMFRKIARAWFRFFLPGFHPWNEDDRHLLRAYDSTASVKPGKVVRGARV